MTSPSQQIAEAIVGPVDWRSSSFGWCVCPGRHLHTKPSEPSAIARFASRKRTALPRAFTVFTQAAAPLWRKRAQRCAVRSRRRNSLRARRPAFSFPGPPPPPEPVFSPEAFKKFAARVKDEINAGWLAASSPVCPWNRTPASFLHALYRRGEKIVIFDVYKSQGQEVWTHPGFPYNALALGRFTKGASVGAWFLTNPVDGEYYPRDGGSRSRRSEASVTSWRYMVVESDLDVPAVDWLRVLVQLPLRIAAIYETGGKLPHALVELSESSSKQEWDRKRDQLLPSLVTLGADPKTMSAVRLSRLPQCERLGTFDRDGAYLAFDKPRVQRLLYLNPPRDYLPGYLDPWADDRPIIEKPVVPSRCPAEDYETADSA